MSIRMLCLSAVAATVLITGTPETGRAQKPAFVKDMRHALAMYDTANTLESILEVAHRMERLTVRHSDEWLAHYWTSFLMTQINVYARDQRGAGYVRLAEFHFNEARKLWDAKVDKPDEEAADMYTLEGFIHSFKASVPEYNADDERTLFKYYLDKALEKNPEHPIVWTLNGLTKLRDEKTRAEGTENIRKALGYYLKPRISSVHPYWSIHFIPYWLKNRAPDVLQEVSVRYTKEGPDLAVLRGHK